MACRVESDETAGLLPRVAEGLAPADASPGVEQCHEAVLHVSAGEGVATEFDAPLELPHDGDVALTVHGEAGGALLLSISEALAPEQPAVGGESGQEDIRA